MADFVPKTIVKSATRVLTNPIDSVSSFDTIVDGVVTDNPFTCTTYTVSGETMDAVAITKRSYGARLVWEDAEAKNVGNTTERYDTSAGFNAGVAIIMESAPLATQHGGTCSHDPDLDTYSATLRCHDANGELYTVTVSRDHIDVSSYSDDAILAKVEAWADSVPTLA
ncbi:MAG: hypothetical protein NTZ39_07685 [Methanoregula sp.]|nr:hypothetical protein [Methanoregula sp.]